MSFVIEISIFFLAQNLYQQCSFFHVNPIKPSYSSIRYWAFGSELLGTWKQHPSCLLFAVELHRVSWCFAATAHTHSCDTAQRELQLLSWSYNKATDFSPAHSSWVIWCLVVTSTEPCRQYSSPPRLTCKLLQSWSGVLKSFYPPTRQLKVTTWIFCTFEVDRSWAKCKPNKLCKSLLNDGSYSSNQIIQQSWQPNSFMFEAWTWQVNRWCQLKYNRRGSSWAVRLGQIFRLISPCSVMVWSEFGVHQSVQLLLIWRTSSWVWPKLTELGSNARLWIHYRWKLLEFEKDLSWQVITRVKEGFYHLESKACGTCLTTWKYHLVYI